MNVLMLTNKLPYPAKDGGAIATLNMAKGMVAHEAVVTILSMNTSKHYFPPHNIPKKISDHINIITVPVNTRIKLLQALINLCFSKIPYNAKRFISRDFLKVLVRIIKDIRIDLFQLEGPYVGYVIPTIRKYSKAPIALRAHNIEHEIWERSGSNEKNIFKQVYFRILAKRIKSLEINLLKSIDFLIPISEKDKSRFIQLGFNRPVHTAPAGLEINNYRFSKPPSDFSLFFLGALDWKPNIEGLSWFLTNVWPKAAGFDLTFHIAGRNPSRYFNEFQDMRNVFIEGEVKDAHQFMCSHSVMIVPLFAGSGIRIKILEGMALGKTIISTSVGAEGIPAKPGKHILIADTAEEFLQHIAVLKSNPEQLGDIGLNAQQFVTENFDNLAISKELVSFYKEHL